MGVFQLQIDVAKASLCLKKFSWRTFNGEFEEANFFSRAATHVAAVVISPAHDTSLSGNENGCDRENAHLTSIYGP